VDRVEFAEAARSDAQLLDVRAPNEWENGIVEGSVLSYLPDLAEQTPSGLSAARPVWIACGSGYRAVTAAGLLQDRGFEPMVLIYDGTSDVLRELSVPV
jgi:rhodanese-related sulfurtransferase